MDRLEWCEGISIGLFRCSVTTTWCERNVNVESCILRCQLNTKISGKDDGVSDACTM